MKIASIREAEICCSLPVMLLLPVAAAFGRLGSFCISGFSLIIHELAHAITAERLGYRIAAIELQPVGCIARLSHQPISYAENAAIAGAGPLASCMLALCAVGITKLIPESAAKLEGFISFNFGIFVLNLFPVLPLDGGRLLDALLSRIMGRTASAKLLTAAGCIFGTMLITLGIVMCVASGRIELPFLMVSIMGIFIVLSAITERKRVSSDRMRIRLNADLRLRRGGALAVSAVAMNENVTVREALASLSGSGYNLVIIVDGFLQRKGTISEGELLDLAMRGRTEQRIGTISINKIY